MHAPNLSTSDSIHAQNRDQVPVILSAAVAILAAAAIVLALAARAEAAPRSAVGTKAVFHVEDVAPEMDLMEFARGLIKEVDAADPKVRYLARGKLGQSAGHARDHGRFVAAALLVEHGIELLENSPLRSAERISAERAELGDLQRRLGHYDAAQRNLRIAIDIARKARPADHAGVARLLYPVALNQMDRERFANSEFLLTRILDRSNLVDPRAIPILNNLAKVYRRLGRFDDAAETLQSALEIAEDRIPGAPGSGLLVRGTYDELGKLAMARRDFADAERWFRRNLDADEARGLEGDPRLGRSLNSLGELFAAEGRYAEAAGSFERALDILNKRLGPPLPLVAAVARNLANVRTQQREFGGAKAMFARAIAVQLASTGVDHPEFAATLLDVGTWFEAQGQTGDAAPLFKRAAAIYTKALGSGHPKSVAAGTKYLGALAQRGEEVAAAFR